MVDTKTISLDIFLFFFISTGISIRPLLSNSTFTRGLTRELPRNVVVAHKFGENVSGNVRQLHESGIVYTGAHTYLITIMTKGTKVTDLADVISDISTQAYQFFKP